MTLAATAHTEIDLTQSEEIERARVRLEHATEALATASEQYRCALAARGEHQTASIKKRIVVSPTMDSGPRYDMERGARHALNTAASHALYSGNTKRGARR